METLQTNALVVKLFMSHMIINQNGQNISGTQTSVIMLKL